MKALPEAEFVDLRIDGIPKDLLLRALTQFGDRLVNRRSTTWRGLSEEERTEDPLNLLRAYPILMKRPLIDTGPRLYLGWDKDTKAALI